MILLNNSSKFRDLGLLVIRVGIGALSIYFGQQKIGGDLVSNWSQIGTAINSVGIHFGYTFWGFMCAFAEFVGGICIVLGLLVRPFTILMLINFVVAFFAMIAAHQVFYALHAVEFFVVIAGLLITGPGKYSVDQLIGLNKEKNQKSVTF